MTMSWSEIPGMFDVDYISVVLFVKTRSKTLFSLVGSLWTWDRLKFDAVSIRVFCTSLSLHCVFVVWLFNLCLDS